MTLTKEQVEALELQKEEAEQAVKAGEALKRLLANPDYEFLIKEQFLKQYPRDMADAIVKNTGAYDAEVLAKNIQAINVFVGFTMKIGSDYNHAVDTVKEIEAILANESLDEDAGE